MEEALAAIRQAITNDEAGEPTLAPAEPQTSREQAGAKPISEAGLLSRQAVPPFFEQSHCRLSLSVWRQPARALTAHALAPHQEA